MEDLKKLQCKPKVSSTEINEFILQHPTWAAFVIRNALALEMYKEFCLCCENFDKCCVKLDVIKREISSGCICNEFLNQEHSETNRPRLRAYFRVVTLMLDF
jgi:hypothetical protein